MATTLTAPIHAGKSFKVRFENDNASTGTVLVVAGWVPKHGKTKPNTRGIVVAPSGSGGFGGTVLPFKIVRRLSITVSLDSGESGLLEVLEDGDVHFRKVVKKTTTFEVPVDP